MTHSENTGKKEQPIPSLEELSGELRREKFRRHYRKLLRSTIYALIVVAAVSVLIATLLLPVLQIYGTSMNPNLTEGDIVVSVKSPSLETGDVIAFYYNNRVLVKRVIATDVPTDIPNRVSSPALPEAESSMITPTTTASSNSTTGE